MFLGGGDGACFCVCGTRWGRRPGECPACAPRSVCGARWRRQRRLKAQRAPRSAADGPKTAAICRGAAMPLASSSAHNLLQSLQARLCLVCVWSSFGCHSPLMRPQRVSSGETETLAVVMASRRGGLIGARRRSATQMSTTRPLGAPLQQFHNFARVPVTGVDRAGSAI